MTVKSAIKQAVYRPRGAFEWVRFEENERPLRMLVSDDTKWNMVREFLLCRIYERPGWFTFADCTGTVIDAGANDGFFSLIAAQYADRVVAIEADVVNAKIVELNAAANDADNVVVLQRALWSSDETLFFQHTGQSASGVVGRDGGEFPVRGVTLAELLVEYPDATALKIDIEGAEFEALGACGDFGGIRRIVGELHQPRNSAAVRELVEQLEAAGFDVDVVDEDYFYSPDMLARARRNRSRVEGELLTKAAVEPYFRLGSRLPSDKELPGLFARR